MELDSSAGLLNACPPGLDKAGLEDCALPAHAIQEAFRRAAGALQTSPWQLHLGAGGGIGSSEPGEVDLETYEDSTAGLWEGASVDHKGIKPLGEEQSCVGTNVGGRAVGGSDLVVAPDGGIFEGGKVVFGKESGPKLGDEGCVEGLPGDKGQDKDSSDPSGETEEGPILVLA